MTDEPATNTPQTSDAHAEPAHVVRTYAQDVADIQQGRVPVPREIQLPPPPTPAPAEEPVMVATPETAPAGIQTDSPLPEREAILARLRALHSNPTDTGEVAKDGPAIGIDVTPAPQPNAPTEENLSESLATTDAKEELPERIHTYKSDFAERIGDTGSTPFSVLAAEQDSQKNVAPDSRKPFGPKGIAFIAGGALLIVLGGVGVYFAYSRAVTPAVVPVSTVAPSLISVDEREEVSGSGTKLLQALAASAGKPLALGAVRLTYLKQDVHTAAGTTTEPAPGGVLIKALNLPAPDILFRNTDPASTVGIVRAGTETRPFFILRVTSYERTFAGMLSWESAMPRDLSLLYPTYPPPPTPIASTTPSSGTSTTPVPKPLPPPLVFRDEILGNYNVRALKDAAGRTLVLYGYRDETTLIIARDEAAFTELAGRLAATKTQ